MLSCSCISSAGADSVLTKAEVAAADGRADGREGELPDELSVKAGAVVTSKVADRDPSVVAGFDLEV